MLGGVQKIGLVLSGGGKGAYEVGVWRAMEQLGLAKDIAAVSGTSVGALNAALFAHLVVITPRMAVKFCSSLKGITGQGVVSADH